MKEQVNGVRVEYPVNELAIVGGAVTVAGEQRVHPRLGEPAVYALDDLRGALPGAYHHEGLLPALIELSQPVEQLRAVPYPRGPQHLRREARLQSGGDHDVPRPERQDLAVGAPPGQYVDVPDLTVHDYRFGIDHSYAVTNQVPQPICCPSEVRVEFHPARIGPFLIDENRQPAHLMDIRQEAEVTGGITHGHQILQEGHLKVGALDEHSPVPAEVRLPFNKGSADRT